MDFGDNDRVAKIPLLFASLSGDLTPVWVAGGVALAAVPQFSNRVRSGRVLGASMVDRSAYGLTVSSLSARSSLAIGNTLSTRGTASPLDRFTNTHQLAAKIPKHY